MPHPTTIEDLLLSLQPKARLIGVDLGSKTIGLAISDVERRIASPLRTLPRGPFGMNAETQEITLTGVVRTEDIAADNTIQSPLVADAQIKYGGKGPVAEKQHDGLLTRVFKILF